MPADPTPGCFHSMRPPSHYPDDCYCHCHCSTALPDANFQAFCRPITITAKSTEAIRFYEPIVKKHMDNLLEAPAIVLANLCVSYIMTSLNEEAEELMRAVEKEEELAQQVNPGKQ
eukprot:21837-Chlamydomonas_euryale.AAC.1